MHQRLSKKILIYFFVFILVSSVGNYHLININFPKDVKFNITGLDESNISKLIKNFKNLKIKNIFFLNKSNISKIIESNSLVENYSVFKKYPSSLMIKIEDTNLLAKINFNNETVDMI